uniref:Uncharacterized protein n=1 Tax=Siphoviridae sp. ctCNm48 TaxID=2825377 RepID=A0A8S5TW96_9CAUD|nr:MAG TPA: hypothetical protein [Siphoviridae sp. ctCNm48]
MGSQVRVLYRAPRKSQFHVKLGLFLCFYRQKVPRFYSLLFLLVTC